MSRDKPSDDEPSEPRFPPGVPMQGQIAHVTGRKAEGGQRGLPALDQLAFSLPDGTVHEFGAPGASGRQGTLNLVSEIWPSSFLAQPGSVPLCPICLVEQPNHQEHVPQEDLGGSVMTMTCQSCNNDLGSRVEVDLQHWFDHALVQVAFDHDGDVQGHRRVPKLYYREAVDGKEFALFIDGDLTPEVEQMMASGQWRMRYREPDPRRYRLALLKHAYLAACLHLHAVPDTADARDIRADLLAARDSPRSVRPSTSEAADRLEVYRSHVGMQGPPLALVATEDGDAESEPRVLISLAGALFVSWPFTDLPPGEWKRADVP